MEHVQETEAGGAKRVMVQANAHIVEALAVLPVKLVMEKDIVENVEAKGKFGALTVKELGNVLDAQELDK